MTDIFFPEKLQRWTMPDHYFGEVWPNYYHAGTGRHRDSDSLTRSNFACMLKALGGETETVIVVRESHWAVGWVEWIAIHQDDETALRIADRIAADLEEYPVINEDHWSELEWTEAADYWDNLSPREKVRHAMDERARYHWLAKTPVWMFGRRSWGDLPDNEIGRALEETLRQC